MWNPFEGSFFVLHIPNWFGGPILIMFILRLRRKSCKKAGNVLCFERIKRTEESVYGTKKKNKRRRRQFQQKVILSVLLVIIIGLIGVLGYQMQKNEKKQTDGNASASSSVSSSSLAGDSSEPISDSSPEEEITPTPEPVQQISSDGLNSQHALLVRESGLAEMMNLGGDERIYPASMTKIMTALLTIENLRI